MKLLYLVESGESKFLVFDEMPDKISTKYGDDTIIGRIGGIFYDFLAKRNERREAFGGRKFDIVLDNGEIEKCEGQWWDAVTDRAREESVISQCFAWVLRDSRRLSALNPCL